jgi:choline-sulfatase
VVDRPDLVLIMTDQQRFDQLGYSSAGHFETPRLDALAADGVIFDQAYSASTTCVPARASLLTGLQHHRVPRVGEGLALEPGYWTVAHALRAAGYETALIGKMHFTPLRADHGFETMRICEDLSAEAGYTAADADDYHDWLTAQGLDDWRGAFQPVGADGEQTYATTEDGGFPYDAAAHPIGWIGAEAARFLRERDGDRPLFLVVSFTNPHAPYNPAEPYASMYPRADSRLPRDGFEVNEALPEPWRRALERPRANRRPRNPRLKRFLATIRGLIRHIDDAVGEVADALDLDRSLMFVTSDHGDYGGHRGLMKKVPWIPFDDLARVPFFVTGAGVEGGRRVTDLVQSHDLALTCLDAAGVLAPDAEFDSRSIRPHLEARAGAAETERVVFCATTTPFAMVRRGSLKLTLNRRQRIPLLCDLEQDPHETTNLADSPDRRADADALTALLDQELWRPIPDLPRFD